MTVHTKRIGSVVKAPTHVIELLRAELPAMQQRALFLDRFGGFPSEDIAFLKNAGALDAFGREDVAPDLLIEALRLVGRGSLSVGRIFEGHVNGALLVSWYGNDFQRRRLDQHLKAGEVYGVWNTEKPPGVTLSGEGDRGALSGLKSFATGAGQIDHAVVTATLANGRKQMVLADAGELTRADTSVWRVRGMKATLSGTYDLSGLPVDDGTRLGREGDYELEPRFSSGAWRFTAVQLGGVERILSLIRGHLAGTTAGENPIQRARFGHALAQARSAYLWVREAARRAESPTTGPSAIAFVLMTRHVVEMAGIKVIEAAERAIGTRAFFEDSPLDQACRDLSLYLRQPAPDLALDRASAAFIEQDQWDDDPLW